MPKRLTQQDFLDRANKVHGDKYDYSKAVYKASDGHIEINCKVHGIFSQKTNCHLSGSGCPKCMDTRVTEKDFLQRSLYKHGNVYDYSKVLYVDTKTNVEIVCKIHGSFWQKPYHHFEKTGCPKCGNIKRSNKAEGFIIKSNVIHGVGRFIYDRVEYVRQYDEVEIGCSIEGHGYFKQIAKNHTKGINGCPKCPFAYHTKTQEAFLAEATAKHGSLFLYEKTIYKNANTMVCITCKIHGDFYQLPGAHTVGRGCNQCAHVAKGKLNIERGHKPPPSKKGQKQPYKYTTETFIDKANFIHEFKYDYSESKFTGSDNQIDIICKLHGKFRQRVALHFQGGGCPKCRGSISSAGTKWLDSLNILVREFKANLPSGRTRRADGYDPATNTCYFFNGSFWHGDPFVYDPHKVNILTKKEFGQIFLDSVRVVNEWREAGYSVVEMWEEDWKRIVSGKEPRSKTVTVSLNWLCSLPITTTTPRKIVKLGRPKKIK